MSSQQKNIEIPDQHIVAEMQAYYEKKEIDLLKDALKRTHMERL